MNVVAPGKVMLFGEYAVLHGHTAIVAAVDRHATCEVLAPEHEGQRRIEAPELGTSCEICMYNGEKAGDGLAIARAAMRSFGWPEPGRYRLDTSPLGHVDEAGIRQKLGMGSSAAVTVALVGAAVAASGRDPATCRPEIFAHAHQGHRAAQGGRGSGADVAASVFGGLVGYRWLEDGGPLDDELDAEPMPGEVSLPAAGGEGRVLRAPHLWPGKLWLVWTREPASTTTLVRFVAAFGERDPMAHDRLMEAIGRNAAFGSSALAGRDRPALVDAVQEAAGLVRALGEQAGVPLWTPAHQSCAAKSERYGCAIKPTGAGGGDLAWLVGPDPAAEAAAAGALRQADCLVMQVTIDPDGVRQG